MYDGRVDRWLLARPVLNDGATILTVGACLSVLVVSLGGGLELSLVIALPVAICGGALAVY